MSSDKWPTTEDETGPLTSGPLRLTLIFVSVVALGLLSAWILDGDEVDIVTIGEPAPGFEVRNVIRDEPVTLEDLINDEGRPIVINLMASWCGPCREEIPELSAFADANPDVIVFGVAVEDVYEAFQRFVADVRPTYPVAFDDGPMRAAYPTLGLPATFFLDSEGNVIEVFNGILDREILEDRVAGIN